MAAAVLGLSGFSYKEVSEDRYAKELQRSPNSHWPDIPGFDDCWVCRLCWGVK